MVLTEASPLLVINLQNNKSRLFISRKIVLLSLGFVIISVLTILLVLLSHQYEPKPSSKSHLDLSTPQGNLRGYVLSSRQGREYYAFYKVPYSQPTIVNLRFQDPQPASGWSGLRDIDRVAPSCIQKDPTSGEAIGDEDCLYANIYSPNPMASANGKYPVMVFIHGGAFLVGDGSRFGADYFMDEEVILVTFQYRLGPLGYLNNGQKSIPGNQGFKDQVMMLRWIQDNIAYYGGDKNRVTIFGHSSGAFSVSYQTLSPLSSGLFHQAITQSCAALCSKIDHNPSNTVNQVAKGVSCPYDDPSLLTCLQSKPASEIALIQTATTIYDVTIETHDGPKFLADTPYNILTNNKSHPVPYIIGITNAEAVVDALRILYDDKKIEEINANFSSVASQFVQANLTLNEYDRVREFYFGSKYIDNETFWNMTNFVSDTEIVCCSYLSAKLHSRVAPAFTYVATKPPAKSYIDKHFPGFPATAMGVVSHVDDLQYFFPFTGYPIIDKDNGEYFPFSKYVVKLWAHFANTGNPSMDNVNWNKWESNSTFWLELNDNPKETHLVDTRMQFWDLLGHKIFGNL